ncbi:GWxTD domain-containing protein [Owenweeksia hongkongensis]|uniref:GWxTD domain-containing protein n=1 Tax=Owenweeksia hongkongensis TaxID=253245 RepID=UPI003A939F95
MNRFKSPVFLTLLFCTIQLSAKNIGIDISYAQFMNEKDEGYLEIYFALAGNSIDFVKNNGGKYRGGVEITAAIKQDSAFITADKFLLQSPELSDTINFAEAYINQVRFPLEKGKYILVLDIKDINDPEETYHFEQEFTLELGDAEPTTSDLLFLDTYTPAKEGSVFAKSGYDLVPMVSSGSYYFNEAVSTLSFYVELYNTKDVLGENEPYILKYYLKNASTNKVLNKYASFAKKTSSTVEPVLASFNIEKLKTGNYNLVVEALNRDGETIINKTTFFYRKNSAPSVDFEDLANTDVTGTFADLIGGIDSLYLFTKFLFPISTDAERNYQKSLLVEKDIKKMKQYFYVFWSQRNDYDPQTEWENYRKRVREVNSLYDSGLRPGFMTDRGRVSLVYGKPILVEQRKFEPGLPPYEIWKYDQLTSRYIDIVNQSNKIFVFAEFNISSNEYELIHSNAIGELNDRRWKVTLGGGSIKSDDLDDNANSGFDDWGSRLNNNILLQNSGDGR